MLLKISVRICPSFWYQMAVSRVLAHGLKRREKYMNNTGNPATQSALERNETRMRKNIRPDMMVGWCSPTGLQLEMKFPRGVLCSISEGWC